MGVLENLDLATAKSTLLDAARDGLTSFPKTLPPWLLYDEQGSRLFEQITGLPEYYLTRTEHAILLQNASEIVEVARGSKSVVVLELGAGTAFKTQVILTELLRVQGPVRYAPVDVSPTALWDAEARINAALEDVAVTPQVADYTRQPLCIRRTAAERRWCSFWDQPLGIIVPRRPYRFWVTFTVNCARAIGC